MIAEEAARTTISPNNPRGPQHYMLLQKASIAPPQPAAMTQADVNMKYRQDLDMQHDIKIPKPTLYQDATENRRAAANGGHGRDPMLQALAPTSPQRSGYPTSASRSFRSRHQRSLSKIFYASPQPTLSATKRPKPQQAVKVAIAGPAPR